MPCKNCESRHVGCHSECAAYQTHVAKQAAIKANKASAYKLEEDYCRARKWKGWCR